MKRHIKHVLNLKREIGLFEATICGVGIIVGAGIYALIGKAAGLAGNAVWLSFILAAVVAGLTGLSYAELSAMFPKSGAEYVYAKKSFGKFLAFLIGWLIIVGGTIAGTAVALGFSGYFSSLFNTPVVPAAIGIILLASTIVFYGIRQSVQITIILTIIEILGLLAIILIGVPYLGSVDYFEMSSAGIGGIFGAAALIFFAFIGFEEIARLSEDTKNPRSVLPKALILSIIITTILYILVGISAVSVLGWEKLGTSNAPLADVAAVALGTNAQTILTIIALFSTANTVLLLILANSRIVYGMAKEGSLPNVLSKMHKKHYSPWVAIAVIALFSVLLAFIGKIETVAMLTDFTVFLTFIVINLSVIILRYKEPETKRAFKIPLNIGKFPILPLLGALLSMFLILSVGQEVIEYGFILILIGIILYMFLDGKEKYAFIKIR